MSRFFIIHGESLHPSLEKKHYFYDSVIAWWINSAALSANLCTYFRPKWEGGQYEGDDNKRFDALRLAMELGADYIDIELKVSFYLVYVMCVLVDHLSVHSKF